MASDMPMIPSEILRKICETWRGWDSGLTGFQIGQILSALSVPDISPNLSKAERLYEALSLAQESTHSGKIVIAFIERVMSPMRYIGEASAFDEQKARINQALAFAGLRLEDTGTVVASNIASTLQDVSWPQKTSVNPRREQEAGGRAAKHVFLSYSRNDRDIVDPLQDTLVRAGLEVWRDHEQIIPGAPDWQLAIQRGINWADVLIYVASETACQSSYVSAEIEAALEEHKPVIPFWVRGEKPSKCIPMALNRTQRIDARGTNYAVGLVDLLKALSTYRTLREADE